MGYLAFFLYLLFLIVTFLRAECYVLLLPINGAERKREIVFASFDMWIGSYIG